MGKRTHVHHVTQIHDFLLRPVYDVGNLSQELNNLLLSLLFDALDQPVVVFLGYDCEVGLFFGHTGASAGLVFR